VALSPALEPERLPDYVDRLYRAAWALCGSSHDAEDLVQETLTRVLARRRRPRHLQELPYLLRALRNTYLNGLRTERRRPRTVELLIPEGLGVCSSSAEPQAAVERRELLASIVTLPEPFRDALAAVDIAGLSYREAARALGIREATLTSRLFRARARIAKALEPGAPTAPAACRGSPS
jgi:RNA polymerase sigma-70 factor, ECF subfamily